MLIRPSTTQPNNYLNSPFAFSAGMTRLHATRPNRARSMTIVLLVLAVLFAQWMGMRHRIEHAGWVNDRPATSQQTALDPDVQSAEQTGQKSPHSCLLFDDATLGNSIVIIPLKLPPPTCARERALWLAFTSWDAPLTSYFSSRAPPAR